MDPITAPPAAPDASRVAAVQCTSGPDVRANLDRVTGAIDRAARAGAELVVLPELVQVMGDAATLRGAAEPLDGPFVSWAASLALRHGVTLVAGTFVEDRGDGVLANTCPVLGPAGDLLGVYRKVHLFDCDVPRAEFHESATFSAGDRALVVDCGRLRVGVMVCYDLRFPEQTRVMADAGADVVAVPAAFTARTGAAHWELLVRARAVEHQVSVVAAGQVGSSGPGLDWWGHSLIVDAWGRTVASADGTTAAVITAPVDLEEQARIRAVLPVRAHRRDLPPVESDTGGQP